MFDLLLNVDSTSISENIELWNQSSRATNVRRINSANHHRGLSMLLNISSEDYFITTDDFIGLKVSPISVLPTNVCFRKYIVLSRKYIFSKMMKVGNTVLSTQNPNYEWVRLIFLVITSDQFFMKSSNLLQFLKLIPS